MVYWGTAWQAHSALQGQIEKALRTILSSRYVTDLSEYDSGIGAGSLAGTHGYTADPQPTNDFSDGTDTAVQHMLGDLIRAGTLPAPTDPQLLIMVLPPPGVTAPSSGALGQHWVFTHTGAQGISSTVRYGWVASDGSQTGTTLDDFTWTLSHEIVEAITDPEMNTWTFNACPGVNGTCEIGDVCNAQYKLNDGTLVQDWYSLKHGRACYSPK